MTAARLISILKSLKTTADSIESLHRETLDPDPDIQNLREAAHLIENTPLEALAKIRPFPTTPTFP